MVFELTLFDISLRVANGKLKTVTTCSRFIRALVAACLPIVYIRNTLFPRKSLCFTLIVFFLIRRENAPDREDGIHCYDPANKRD